MTAVVLAVAASLAAPLADGLRREGLDVRAQVTATELLLRPHELLAGTDALVLDLADGVLSAQLVASCDRLGVRIVALAADVAAERMAHAFGLAAPLPRDVESWRLADAITAPVPAAAPPAPSGGRVVVVWGPAGAPGRSTLAVELAVELARGGRHVALADADSHAPSLALALGLADEGPGFAAACRQAGRGLLDAAELTRISTPLGVRDGAVDVLTGINRPSRWPELRAEHVDATLQVCRDWVEHVVVDTAAPLERDEELVSDTEGPRRNAATLAALASADLVVAVASADPLGVARFVRAHAQLRATIGAVPIAVVANRLRPGALGVDSRGQVRRTLERFAGIREVAFLPLDARAADAAMLAARPIAEVAPRSPLVLAVRRFVGTAIVPAPAAPVRARRAPRAAQRARSA